MIERAGNNAQLFMGMKMNKQTGNFIVGFGSLCIWAVLVGLAIGAYVTVSENISYIKVDNSAYTVTTVAYRQDMPGGILMPEGVVEK